MLETLWNRESMFILICKEELLKDLLKYQVLNLEIEFFVSLHIGRGFDVGILYKLMNLCCKIMKNTYLDLVGYKRAFGGYWGRPKREKWKIELQNSVYNFSYSCVGGIHDPLSPPHEPRRSGDVFGCILEVATQATRPWSAQMCSCFATL